MRSIVTTELLPEGGTGGSWCIAEIKRLNKVQRCNSEKSEKNVDALVNVTHTFESGTLNEVVGC